MMNTKTGKLVVFILAALALLLLPLVLQATGSNSWARIVDLALLYVLLALGLNIVVGYAGLLDLGYIAFYAVGAYLFALLASPHLVENLPAVAAMSIRVSSENRLTLPRIRSETLGWVTPNSSAASA